MTLFRVFVISAEAAPFLSLALSLLVVPPAARALPDSGWGYQRLPAEREFVAEEGDPVGCLQVVGQREGDQQQARSACSVAVA